MMDRMKAGNTGDCKLEVSDTARSQNNREKKKILQNSFGVGV